MTNKVPTKYDYPSSQTGGVKPMSIRGLFDDEMNRISEEFTDEERKWRKQWIKDQELSPNEPRPASEELIKEVRNPIRRFLSKPWQLLEDKMTPVFGYTASNCIRYLIPKFLVITAATYYAWYHLKYNHNDWTQAYGISVHYPRPVAVPGQKEFPLKIKEMEPSDYADCGFKSRKVFLD